jgi:uroporphyrinogen decarboxylase
MQQVKERARPKELVLAAMEGKEKSRTAAVLFSGGAWTCKQAGYLLHQLVGRPEVLADSIISVNSTIESDMVFPGSGFNNYLLEALGGKLKLFGDAVPMLEGPVVQKKYSFDIPISRSLEQNLGIQTVVKAVQLVQKKIGNEILVATPAWGPVTTAAMLLGVEEFMRKLKREPDFIHTVLTFATKAVRCYYYQLKQEANLPVASVAEPIVSAAMISVDNFKTFAMPYLMKLVKDLKQLDYKVILHICGATEDRYNLITGLNLDCLSLDQQVNLNNARNVVGKNLCLAGNLDPVNLLERSQLREVINKTETILSQFARDKRFILAAGCDLPPSVRIENVTAYLQAAKKFNPKS